MTRCVCGHLRTAHLLPEGECGRCPEARPCEGFEPDEETA